MTNGEFFVARPSWLWGRQASCLSIRGQDARKPSQAGSLTSDWEFAGRRSFLLLLVKNRADQVLRHLLEMGGLH